LLADSSGPLYERVRQTLERMALGRPLHDDTPLPPEPALMDTLGVSRGTLRRAIEELTRDGLLVAEQGRGTFVAPSKMDLEVRLSSFGEEMRRRGMEPSSKVLAAEEIAAASDIADALDLLPGEQVCYLHRVRYADGEPMAIEQSWLPGRLAPGLYDDGPPASVYGELRRRGLELDWGEDTVAAAEVDAQDADLLGLPVGRAVLRMTRRTFAGETACVYSRSSYRADRYVLWVPLRAPRRSITPQLTTQTAFQPPMTTAAHSLGSQPA